MFSCFHGLIQLICLLLYNNFPLLLLVILASSCQNTTQLHVHFKTAYFLIGSHRSIETLSNNDGTYDQLIGPCTTLMKPLEGVRRIVFN